ncbi:hypothetical protein ACSMXN_20360 [Jatrophihabitans sp. DSM 45814]
MVKPSGSIALVPGSIRGISFAIARSRSSRAARVITLGCRGAPRRIASEPGIAELTTDLPGPEATLYRLARAAAKPIRAFDGNRARTVVPRRLAVALGLKAVVPSVYEPLGRRFG